MNKMMQTAKNTSTRPLVQSSLLLALALAVQFLGRGQPFVGPTVNAILLITTFWCGIFWGLLVGLMTPLLAFLSGIFPLAPFVPFIVIGNAIMILSFGMLKNRPPYGRYLGVITGAFLKFAFLLLSATHVATWFGISLPGKVVTMMGLPQLVTALAGGAIALMIIRLLEDRRMLG